MEAKLALAEFLLSSTDLQVSARHATDWLAVHLGVRQAAVVVAEPGSTNLMLIAEHGVSSGIIADFTIPRADTSHPLVRAMSAPTPSLFASSAVLLRAPVAVSSLLDVLDDVGVRDDGFHAVPLRADDESEALGLLLVSADTPEILSDVVWVARLLARQATRLLSAGPLADVHFGQERMLLYSIINAVTDPILLTDTEGKLIIANSHAEKLFAAPEEASEGWRRAVALNNMLFSAALSTSAVGTAELARRELLLVDPLEGSDLLFELLSSRAKDERQGTYVVSILRNVTDLARAKEEIEESYRTLRRRAGGGPRRASSARSDHRLGRRSRSWSPTRKGTSC